MKISKSTLQLIDKMCELVERKDFILEKEKAEDCILKTYDLFKLKRPTKIVWLKDIFDKKWIDITKSVGSAGSARSARSAWSALDYDFDWFVIEHEYIKNRKDNQGEEPTNDDKIYLEYSELLMEAIECGLGYRIEFEDTLYLIPTSLVLIDEQNRFHSTKEPSIKWKDGKELYYLHGINFEKEWWNKIVNDKMTPEEIFAIDNLEHRRIAYEYMDKTKMRLLKDYKILDEIKDDGYGYAMKVISFSIKGIDEPLKYLNVFCPSTGREYFIGTNENNCLEAKSKSFGLDKDTEFIKEW